MIVTTLEFVAQFVIYFICDLGEEHGLDEWQNKIALKRWNSNSGKEARSLTITSNIKIAELAFGGCRVSE